MFCLSMYIHVQVVLSRDCFQGVIARSLKEIVHFLIDAYRLIDILKTRSLMILYTHNVQHVCIYIYIYILYILREVLGISSVRLNYPAGCRLNVWQNSLTFKGDQLASRCSLSDDASLNELKFVW